MVSQNKLEELEKGILYKTHFENRELKKSSILERMKHYRTSALSMVFVKDFKLEWVKAYGSKRRDGIEKIDENTMFQAGSVSKPIFAIGVMRLVEQGVLDLDEDVNKYLTSWKVPKNGTWQPRITLRQILSHTAGTTVHGFDGYHVDDEIPSIIQILNGEYPSNSEAIEVNSIPGLNFRYSGGGFTIAQQVVVDVLKKPFHEIMRELVLDPLGMKHSTFEQPIPLKYVENIPYGYDCDEIRGMYHIYPEMAAAGLWTTPSDLAKVGLELQWILKGKENGILKIGSVNKMFKSEVEIKPQLSNGIGFRLYKNSDGKVSRFGHSGMNNGFESDFLFDINSGTGFVIMINSNEGNLMEEVTNTIAEIYSMEVGTIPKKVTAIEEELNIDDFRGSYTNGDGKTINILVKEMKVYLQIQNQEYIEFENNSKNTFVSKDINTCLKFSIDEDGEKLLTLIEDDKERVFKFIKA